MFGRNKSTRETTKNCSGKSSSNVEAGSEVRQASSSKKGRNKGANSKCSRG
jgi:hypothetical protein